MSIALAFPQGSPVDRILDNFVCRRELQWQIARQSERILAKYRSGVIWILGSVRFIGFCMGMGLFQGV
jgi:hypothetical protein